jgi:hypothetical protein
VTLKPLKGSDYFQEDVDNDMSFDSFVDSSNCMEYLTVGERSGILTAPVYLDPSYALASESSVNRSVDLGSRR